MRPIPIVLATLIVISGCGGDRMEDAPPGWDLDEPNVDPGPPNPNPDPPPNTRPGPDPNPDPRPNPNPNPDPDPEPDPDPDPPNSRPDPDPNPNPGSDPEPLPAPCDTNPRPARCDEDPDTNPWSTAAIVNELVISGTENSPQCCFDLTGNGQIDNSYGMNLAGFGFLNDTNNQLEDAIQSGTATMVIELDGLDVDALQGPVRLNWWLAQWGPQMTQISPDGDNPVLIEASSIDAGSQPNTYWQFAGIRGNAPVVGQSQLVATNGVIRLPLSIFGFDLGYTTYRRARLEAVVDTDPFLTLQAGMIGAAMPVVEIMATANEYAENNCACLGLNEPLVDKLTGQCSPNADVMACSADPICEELAGACNLFGAIGLFADVDRDGDGLNDAVSVGMTFSAVPADIVGVAP